MNQAQVDELLPQSLEHELGGVKVARAEASAEKAR